MVGSAVGGVVGVGVTVGGTVGVEVAGLGIVATGVTGAGVARCVAVGVGDGVRVGWSVGVAVWTGNEVGVPVEVGDGDSRVTVGVGVAVGSSSGGGEILPDNTSNNSTPCTNKNAALPAFNQMESGVNRLNRNATPAATTPITRVTIKARASSPVTTVTTVPANAAAEIPRDNSHRAFWPLSDACC